MDGHFLARLKLNGIFCQVVDCGSMGKAAQSLGMTTSAVSQHISRLETELGMTLLNRTTRKLNLSEAGERYYAKGKTALEAAKSNTHWLAHYALLYLSASRPNLSHKRLVH